MNRMPSSIPGTTKKLDFSPTKSRILPYEKSVFCSLRKLQLHVQLQVQVYSESKANLQGSALMTVSRGTLVKFHR